jgi:hypothetical protein
MVAPSAQRKSSGSMVCIWTCITRSIPCREAGRRARPDGAGSGDSLRSVR